MLVAHWPRFPCKVIDWTSPVNKVMPHIARRCSTSCIMDESPSSRMKRKNNGNVRGLTRCGTTCMAGDQNHRLDRCGRDACAQASQRGRTLSLPVLHPGRYAARLRSLRIGGRMSLRPSVSAATTAAALSSVTGCASAGVLGHHSSSV